MNIINWIVESWDKATSRVTGTSAEASEFEQWCADNKVDIIDCGSALNSSGNLFRATSIEGVKTFIKRNRIICIEKVTPYYYAINNFGEGIIGKV